MDLSGYDVFFTSPGERDQMTCQVCGAQCLVFRNQLDTTGVAAAMARQSALHDRFECPHRHEQWHATAHKLIQEINQTASPSLASIIRQDLQQLLKKYQFT